MYLQHFGFNEFPFTLTPNLHYFCELDAYREALDLLLVSLANGEGFIKITGEVGTGKTLLCRKLLDNLGEEYLTAYISNPNLDYFNLQKAIAKELEIPFAETTDQYGLLTILNEHLIKFCHEKKHVVIIIDEAHILSDQALDGLRLLGNLETESTKLIQIVLVGQPELDKRLNNTNMRQLKQRISFSYKLPTLSSSELDIYLYHRLAKAGYEKPHHTLFSKKGVRMILKASRGVPRLVNILCHKALLLSYGHNKDKVNPAMVKMAIHDTESVEKTPRERTINLVETIGFICLLALLGVGSYFIGSQIALRFL
ncbi:MAG: AAA family ATPase [Gammaproteobacteria bacterium]|nr:AAA family ATPase [Gammaproteobacteria bacterium]